MMLLSLKSVVFFLTLIPLWIQNQQFVHPLPVISHLGGKERRSCFQKVYQKNVETISSNLQYTSSRYLLVQILFHGLTQMLLRGWDFPWMFQASLYIWRWDPATHLCRFLVGRVAACAFDIIHREPSG